GRPLPNPRDASTNETNAHVEVLAKRLAFGLLHADHVVRRVRDDFAQKAEIELRIASGLTPDEDAGKGRERSQIDAALESVLFLESLEELHVTVRRPLVERERTGRLPLLPVLSPSYDEADLAPVRPFLNDSPGLGLVWSQGAGKPGRKLAKPMIDGTDFGRQAEATRNDLPPAVTRHASDH